jgi:hypothetical protein
MNRLRRHATTAGLAFVTVMLALVPARAQGDLGGPLPIRDMTPYNILRLDMRPAAAVAPDRGGWQLETNLSDSNAFLMSDNVAAYLRGRDHSGPLTAADVEAIHALGEDAYYLDGETALLDLSLRYALTDRSSVHVTLSAYSFSGGFLDGTIEGFHDTFGLENAGRDLVSRDRFQYVSSIDGALFSSVDTPVDSGLGDPVIGFRTVRPLGRSRWGLALTGEAKLAWRGERLFLSTGTNDVGLQAELQGRYRRQGVYVGASFVSTDGRVFGVQLKRRVVPTLTLAYEAAFTQLTNVIVQVYASEASGLDTILSELRATKYEASLGVRSRRGRVLYGFAVTENLKSFENTPDIGLSLNLSWLGARS